MKNGERWLLHENFERLACAGSYDEFFAVWTITVFAYFLKTFDFNGCIFACYEAVVRFAKSVQEVHLYRRKTEKVRMCSADSSKTQKLLIIIQSILARLARGRQTCEWA